MLTAEPNRERSTSQVSAPDAGAPPNDPLADATGLGPVERASLATLLGHICERLSNLESKLTSKEDESRSGSVTLKLAEILLGGWPAFGLIFMLLFYVPVRDAINAIPEKVKSAEELGVWGVSLKTTLRVEAEKIGAVQLSETLPALTPAAVELLLRASREYNGLISYSEENGLLKYINLPSEELLATLEELESKSLITVYVDSIGGPADTKALRAAILAFRKQYPGSEEHSTGDEQVTWTLKEPRSFEPPLYNWRLTDLGKKAVDVILKAVSSQLAPQSATGPKSPK